MTRIMQRFIHITRTEAKQRMRQYVKYLCKIILDRHTKPLRDSARNASAEHPKTAALVCPAQDKVC